MKRVAKKRILMIVLIVIILIVGISSFFILTSDKYALRQIGYERDEINVILEKLNQDHLNIVLDMEYVEKLVDILNEQYYMSKNFEKYLDFLEEEPDKDTRTIVAMVNVGAYRKWYEGIILADTSKGIAMLVNTFHKLDENYTPENLVNISNWYAFAGHRIRQEVNEAYEKMAQAANQEGLRLIATSSFRTHAEQQSLFERYGDGHAARPGHSEHQTGLALDIVAPYVIGNEFEGTPEFAWLQINAHRFGFIIRYPKDKKYLTGYDYESWHYRYLGVELATRVFNSGLTFDEFYAFYLAN